MGVLASSGLEFGVWSTYLVWSLLVGFSVWGFEGSEGLQCFFGGLNHREYILSWTLQRGQ